MKTHVRSCYLLLCLVLLYCTRTAFADYSSTVTGFSPLAYWRFNEATVSPPLNKVANAGSLGAATDGIVAAGGLTGQPGALGVLGNSVRLANVGGSIGYCSSKVDVPYNAALNPNGPFSVEFWAKPNDMPASDSPTFTGLCLASSLDPNFLTGGNRSGYVIYMRGGGTGPNAQFNGKIQFRLGNTGGYLATCDSASGALTSGTWSHVVCTWDGTTMRNYVNGTEVGSLTLTPTQIASWTQNRQQSFRLGGTVLNGTLTDAPTISADGRAGNRGFDGWMDEAAFYNSALSASTIAAHYAAATTNAAGYSAQILTASPALYLNMNEAANPAPSPGSLPIAANSGSLGGVVNGTNTWGVLANQSGPAYAGFGAGNKACYFDGFSQGHLALPADPGLNVSGNITMMAWVKPSVKDCFRYILVNGWDANYAETYLRISRGPGAPVANPPNDYYGYGDNNYYEVGVSDGASADAAARYVIPDGDIGNWVFIAGTYDGTAWRLYRNGVQVSSVTTARGATANAAPWSVGARSTPTDVEGALFGGHIDEPAIFNTALSASDIFNVYNAAQVPPVITRAVQNPGTIFKGASASFSVWAEGSPTLSYLWLSNGVSTGVTTTNFTASNLAAGATTIAVAVSNPYGSTTSSVAFAVVAAPPGFVQQPAPVARYAGLPFTFSVVASGSTPMSYQWKSNGVAISGATSSSYNGIASAATAGSYICTLSNETFVVTNSAAATLTVVTPPTALGAAVIADSPVAYWRLGEASGSTAFDYYGGHNGTYLATALGQPGYSLLDPNTAVAFNGENSLVGNINGDPATGGVNFQGLVNFSVEAWVNGPAGLAEESTIIAKGTGATGTTASEQFALDVASNPLSGNAAFRFFTRGGGNTFYQAFADIGPDGSWHHVVGVYDQLNVLGLGVRLHIFVDGELRGSAATRAAGVRASTSPVSIGSKRKGNDPDYDGVFNGAVDEVAVYSYALSVNQISNHYALAYGTSTKPTITKQPLSMTAYESSPIPPKLEVGAYGTQPLTYQWKKNGVDLTDDGLHIFGANTRALTISDPLISPLTAADAGNYSVSINNSVGPVTNSAVATLSVIAAPTNAINVPGLVLHLTFDGNLGDSSGRGNHGTGMHTTKTSTNTAAPNPSNPDFYYEAAGRIGQALHYHTATTNAGNGDVTNAYYVTLGDKADLRFSSNVNFSVSYWAKFPPFNGENDLGDLPFIATATTSYGAPGYTFAPSYQLGSWSYSLNGNVQLYGLDYLLDDGAWHHIAHTFDRTGLAITYIDGQQKDVRSVTAAGDLDTGNAVTIGQTPTGTYPEEGYYDIDDVGIWRRALTSQEVVGIYLAATLINSSFVDITPSIAKGPAANQVTITWQAGTLQSSSNAAGPYVDVPAAVSPYVDTATGVKFYRTRY